MDQKKQSVPQRFLPGAALMLAWMLSACAQEQSIKFRIDSEPEGAYLLYQREDEKSPCAGKWIYLGNTPFQGIYQFDRSRLRASGKVALRVMRQGYMDQSKAWTGQAFSDEASTRGVIFWRPELTRATEK